MELGPHAPREVLIYCINVAGTVEIHGGFFFFFKYSMYIHPPPPPSMAGSGTVYLQNVDGERKE